ncbi:hypothetical protein E2R60_05140 [Paenibacillus dendritiformis]|uniref:hypothetical protein n=1 Tax=Paenibacillus dendritiformis TaxID=130049 RepID=UPI001059BAD1|nr:hypothetical protein [Paenibacillus dendritiformis]TDL57863.1 hypothetical protein E2R60_05140 [Paenibacillus dendritiformis]
MKHIVMYSGGIGSWAAAKRVAEQHRTRDLILLFTDTLIEDEDLYRFLRESAENLGGELVWLQDGRDPWQVFRDVRWIGNSRVAQCSEHLKQRVAREWIESQFTPDEAILYVGIDWTEIHRMKAITKGWSPYKVLAPMTEPPYWDKQEMLRALAKDGIRNPRLYDMGFAHNNCGGFCVRAGQGHFINLLKKKRGLYLYHETKELEMQEYLGRFDISILTRTLNGKDQTLTLRQLREEWENGLGMQIDMDDIGGCGCFAFDAEEGPN